jgi:hypothetical protein
MYMKTLAFYILIESLIILLSILFHGFTTEALQTATRFSGRLSLAVFSLIFLCKNRSGSWKFWITDKPYLLFAIIHGIHLALVFLFITTAGINLIPIRVLGGFLAYALIFLMPILSTRAQSGKVSLRSFQRIETIFIYYTWFMFFMAYLPRIQGKLPTAGGTFEEHLILFCWVIAIFVLRLFSRFKINTLR